MDIDTLFNNTLSQYGQRLDADTVKYLSETYQMGDRDIAVTTLISCLVDLGYNEEQLLQGPLGRLTQAIGETDVGSISADPAAIQIDPRNRPDPFAAYGPAGEEPTQPQVQGQVIQPQFQGQELQAQPQEPSVIQPTQPQPQPPEGSADDGTTIKLH